MQEANILYKNGEYEKALEIYSFIKSDKKDVKSIVYYNIGNTYVRLKEFKKARDAYLKSLTLEFTSEADENLRYIKEVKKFGLKVNIDLLVHSYVIVVLKDGAAPTEDEDEV